MQDPAYLNSSEAFIGRDTKYYNAACIYPLPSQPSPTSLGHAMISFSGNIIQHGRRWMTGLLERLPRDCRK